VHCASSQQWFCLRLVRPIGSWEKKTMIAVVAASIVESRLAVGHRVSGA